jgi:hypothetical protein
VSREQILLRRIRLVTWLFIIGLVISGATAIPLESEVAWLAHVTGAQRLVETPFSTEPPAWALWLTKVQSSLHGVSKAYSFLFYGTDWLAFGHFMIAIAFLGAIRDPVRNAWLFTFGMIACALVIPYALVFGAVRGIPFWWRLIDGCFGVVGFVPLWLCRNWVRELEEREFALTLPSPPGEGTTIGRAGKVTER